MASYFRYNVKGMCQRKIVRLVLLEVRCQQKNMLAVNCSEIKKKNFQFYIIFISIDLQFFILFSYHIHGFVAPWYMK
jgi:hypothetical protein